MQKLGWLVWKKRIYEKTSSNLNNLKRNVVDIKLSNNNEIKNLKNDLMSNSWNYEFCNDGNNENILWTNIAQKRCFPLSISLVNESKFSFLRICSHSPKKSLMENIIFCAVKVIDIMPNIISKLLCNFIEITLGDGCSPVYLLHIFRAPFPKNTSGRLLLFIWRERSNTSVKTFSFTKLYDKIVFVTVFFD